MRASVFAAMISAALAVGAAGTASAYVGPSFIQIPGVDGGWKGESYKTWFKVDGNYWPSRPIGLGGSMRKPAVFSGPASPREGAGKLMIAIDKDSPTYPQFMDRCLHKTPIAEMTYAESSDLARTTFEIGVRPAAIPEYYEYKLKDAQFSDCPVVAEAPQQAFVVSFNAIERINYQLADSGVDARLDPSSLAPATSDSKTRSFVLTWFGLAQDVSDDQCPVMNQKPTEDDYYALMPKEDADKERAERAGKGGVNYENGQMSLRGPHKLNAAMLPGIVRDPGNAEPQTKIARGLDLDRDDGTGAVPAGVCRHANYTSVDGRKGIDNQLYRVEGCVQSYQGHKGFMLQFANNQMRDGQMAILLQVSGIDNEKNDDSVDVTVFYSLDPMVKNAAGSAALPDYTFRVTEDSKFTHYYRRLHGRIVNGVLTTDPVKELQMNLGIYGEPPHLRIFDARMRIEMSSGGVKGVLGGYQDWRIIASRPTSSAAEQVHNFQVPAFYNALKRAADGMKDPVTGQCNGISSAYDIEGIPAFIEPAAVKGKEHRDVAQAERPQQTR